HDTAFIVEHSGHADAGLQSFSAPGGVEGGRSWDTSSGWFGGWNPLAYRYLSPDGDDLLDLGTAGWIQTLGARHVGGGPAAVSRGGLPLDELEYTPGDPETNVLDPSTGEALPWSWDESGLVEMNCFLCHLPNPNNEARIESLETGEFRWASTATLLGTGVVSQEEDGWVWNAEAFNADGDVNPNLLSIQDPDDRACGNCHGLVQSDYQIPFTTTGCELGAWTTRTSGQIISAQRLSDSGMNIPGKEGLTRSWDIHTERLVACTDCHYSLNNPAYVEKTDESPTEHLSFDPRRLEIGEYLLQPLHEFARPGYGSTGFSHPHTEAVDGCTSCHQVEGTHTWLPYPDRHMEELACESCHAPRMYAPAVQTYDWTVLNSQGDPNTACRGVDGEAGTITALIEGFEPVLIERQDGDGSTSLAPYNLVTSWYWVYGDPPRPVRLADLEAAWLDGEDYHPEIVALFDANRDGAVDEAERVLDSEEKVSSIAGRLEGLGLEDPHIEGDVQPYAISHTIAADEWAIRDCSTCHSESSRVTQGMVLSAYIPGEVMPALISGGGASPGGELVRAEDGSLAYKPQPEEDGTYIIGHTSVRWVDWFGTLLFLGTLAGVTLHGGLRFYHSFKSRDLAPPEAEKVYMYGMYERLWHWLQTFAILALLFTGLIIHKPEMFGIFSFPFMVQVHNVLGFILVANALLAAFYHLASGEIRQYIPRTHGFFDQAFTQLEFYLRGIFKGEKHPFEKTPESKLNPLQKITYFAILNVLLPLQILTGILMWGTQRWPDLAAGLGGLGPMAALHTLVAWSFASFIVLHVYLTTTGRTTSAGIRSMVMGWEDVEGGAPVEEKGTVAS
ncbi:MAG TPA: cytochrome b/b6 domain-containing protein, partial [Anaerolineales bacterium]|nr:cytochrome b/b6 domain-containing protein [Anaerolineales bacterium]